jgi:tetratricopeptide (TPR) repeat protein
MLIRQGRIAEALVAVSAGGRFRELHTGSRGIESTAYLCWISVIRGEDDRAEKYLNDGLALLAERSSWPWEVGLRLAVARLRLRQHRLEEAETSLVRSLELTLRSGPTALQSLWHIETLSLLVRWSLLLGDLERAERHRGELEAFVRRFDIGLGWAFAWRAEAECLVAKGRALGESLRLLEQSAETWEKLEWGHELAVTLAQLGDLYRRSGDRNRAEAALRRALGMFTEMSARPEMARLQALLAG